jgi:hypothetical protein
MVRDVFRSQVAVGDGNVQILVDVDGSTQFGHVQGGVALQVRNVPVLTPRARRDLVGRDALIEQVSWDLYRQTSVQLFGAPGVGRTAVAEAVLRQLAAVRGVELRPQNQPHTLESLYRRLVHVFFGEIWYQPEEAVLRLEVARADLHALIVITDCDLDHEDLSRLLGSFPGCTFLLTSRRQTLSEDAGAAYEVDLLTPSQAHQLVTRELGSDLAGLQNLQWTEAYRLAGGQVQRLMEHVAFIKRAATRPGHTDLQAAPLKEQVAILVAGLSEPARQVLIALATFGITLTPALFGAVTGLPGAARAAGELVAAGLVKEEGDAFSITLDAAQVVAEGGERADPKVAADGLMPLLEAPDPPDPHLLLAVARALHDAGNDAYTSWLTRAAAPLALAAGEVEVWIRLVALGTQAATKSRRKLDLEFFLNEQHTSSLLRGDTVAAAAALAALGALLSNQHAPAPAATRTARQGRQGRRLIRQGRRALSVRHGVVAAAAVVAVATVLVAATRPGPPTRDTAKSLSKAVTCGVVTTDDVSGVPAGGGRGPGGTMEVLTPTSPAARTPPADDIFVHPGCPQPVPSRSPCPGPRSAEAARAPAPARRAACCRDRGGDRGIEVVRRYRAVGRRRRRGRARRAGRGARPGRGIHVPARVRPDQP